MKKNKCLKCGHEWLPRMEKKSIECPACKSRRWDEKKNGIKNNNKKKRKGGK